MARCIGVRVRIYRQLYSSPKKKKELFRSNVYIDSRFVRWTNSTPMESARPAESVMANRKCVTRLPAPSPSHPFFHLPPSFFFFSIAPARLELSRDEPRRWFHSRRIPRKSPSGSLTLNEAFREFRGGKRKSDESR